MITMSIVVLKNTKKFENITTCHCRTTAEIKTEPVDMKLDVKNVKVVHVLDGRRSWGRDIYRQMTKCIH